LFSPDKEILLKNGEFVLAVPDRKKDVYPETSEDSADENQPVV